MSGRTPDFISEYAASRDSTFSDKRSATMLPQTPLRSPKSSNHPSQDSSPMAPRRERLLSSITLSYRLGAFLAIFDRDGGRCILSKSFILRSASSNRSESQ